MKENNVKKRKTSFYVILSWKQKAPGLNSKTCTMKESKPIFTDWHMICNQSGNVCIRVEDNKLNIFLFSFLFLFLNLKLGYSMMLQAVTSYESTKEHHQRTSY